MTLNDARGDDKLITFARPNRTFLYVIYGQTEHEIN
jgi:hypothetical protein